jgi:hypothetical protein
VCQTPTTVSNEKLNSQPSTQAPTKKMQAAEASCLRREYKAKLVQLLANKKEERKRQIAEIMSNIKAAQEGNSN